MIQLDTPPQACFVTNEKPKTEKETHHHTIRIQYDDMTLLKI